MEEYERKHDFDGFIGIDSSDCDFYLGMDSYLNPTIFGGEEFIKLNETRIVMPHYMRR